MTQHCGTCIKCLPQPWFLSLLSLGLSLLLLRSAILISFYTYHGLLTRLVWVIASLASLHLFCNRLYCSIPVCTRVKSSWNSRALAVGSCILNLPATFSFQYKGCSHYAGKHSNFVHRGTMVTLFYVFLKVSPDIIIRCNRRIFRFY